MVTHSSIVAEKSMEEGPGNTVHAVSKDSADATEHTSVLPLRECVTIFGEGHTGNPIVGLGSW